jgi:ERF superfamily
VSEPKPALEPVPEPPKALNLGQKILEIQRAAGIVKKRGKFGSEMGNSNYLRIEDTVMAVGKLLVEQGLILTGTLQRTPDGSFHYYTQPHTTKGYIAKVVMEWTLEDVASGEKRSWNIPGEGYDGTDKGTPKSQTSSRKYAIIIIFNLAVGNDVEAQGAPSFEDGKAKQKATAANKIAAAAAHGNKTAIEAMSQVETEKKLIIARPEEMNGHFIIATGFIAAPQLDTFFEDTGCKRLNSKTSGKAGWKCPQEYEKGLLLLCEKLGIEVEG